MSFYSVWRFIKVDSYYLILKRLTIAEFLCLDSFSISETVISHEEIQQFVRSIESVETKRNTLYIGIPRIVMRF